MDEARTQQHEDEDDESLLDELREMPVGTNDPNIVGEVAPTDIPPGSDPQRADDVTLEAPGETE